MGGLTSKDGQEKEKGPMIMIGYFDSDFGDMYMDSMRQLNPVNWKGGIPMEGKLKTGTEVKREHVRLMHWAAFGRCSMRPIAMRYFSSTDVLILGISNNKEFWNNYSMKEHIYNIVSEPDLKNVTMLAVLCSDKLCEEDDSKKYASVEEMREEFQSSSLMFPGQSWHFMESPTVDLAVLEEAMRLVKAQYNDTQPADEAVLPAEKVSTGKMGKIRHKFINVWKSISA